MNGLIIRPCRVTDAPELAELYHRAVREGAAAHYDAAQRAAWSPAPPKGEAWRRRLIEAQTVVAERAERLLGFMTLDMSTGWIDFAYVAPEAMGQGVAETLYAVLEGRARAAGLTRLETGASLLAERFFARRGWHVVARQTVERDGQLLANATMAKDLHQASRRVA
ncbi:GNAT family N-acetyltransferase [Roseicyclus marinus]|uniref:GNAT family N-acetyltransferase n=1 Tax=Roseicyclus marinus TaxID=2161673 RepID=UPI002410A78C|nr:GNAT family N-acetyltransferase [Roseicyclus marinus]MDG3042392.1 GNAT family N-acetyltransferase [Roseicyclus marinus]